MAATPQAERRAARVPMSSARRRMSSSSGLVHERESLFWNKSAVSLRFSKGSLYFKALATYSEDEFGVDTESVCKNHGTLVIQAESASVSHLTLKLK